MNIYTDGACTSPGSPGAYAGYGVYFENHDDWNISRPLKGKQTHICAELYAVYVALKRIYWKDVKGDVNIHIDCSDIVNGLSKRRKPGAANYELWMKTYKAYDVVSKYCNITITKVKGHSGNRGNEIADKLAVAGKYKNELAP